MIVFECEECHRSLTAFESDEEIVCSHCGKTITVPQQEPDPLTETLSELPETPPDSDEQRGEQR